MASRAIRSAPTHPGGSSSGSAVAVAAGLVPFALGTDTAGSGRVPAGLNNIVGLKPSLGLISTAAWCRPAARSTASRCSRSRSTMRWRAFAAMAGPDDADPFSRTAARRGDATARQSARRRAAQRQRIFFGDKRAEAAYDAALKRCARSAPRSSKSISSRSTKPRGCSTKARGWPSAIGPRSAASSPEAVHPVTREIIVAGARLKRGRHVRRALPAGGAAQAAPSAPSSRSMCWWCRRRRRPTPSRRSRPIRSAQQPARHLHQFRQPARSLRPRGAGGDARRRHAVRRHACWRPQGKMRCSRASAACFMPTPGCRSAPGRWRSLRLRRLPRRRRRSRGRRGRRASLRHAAQRRTAGARRAPARGDQRPRRTTSSTR